MYESEAFLSRIDGIQFNLLFFFATYGMFHLLGWGDELKKSSRDREDFFFTRRNNNFRTKYY